MILHRCSFRPVFVLVTGLLLAGLPLGCGRQPPPAEEANPAPVKWEPAGDKVLRDWIELVGTTQPTPDRIARISAPVEGRVVSVLGGAKRVAEGQQVSAGTVLIQLDTSVLQANRDKVHASLQVLEEEKKQAEHAVELAIIEDNALQDLQRLQEQRQRDANANRSSVGTVSLVSQIQLDKAKIAVKDTQSKLKAAELRQKAGAKELEALDAQLKLYAVATPIKGRLDRILVSPGQVLSVGTPIAEVTDFEEEIDVLCFVPPPLAQQLREAKTPPQAYLGGMAEAIAGKLTGTVGKVVFDSNRDEIETGSVAVKVRFTSQELQPEERKGNRVVRLRVLARPKKVCLAIRESALLEDQDPPAVFVVEKVEPFKTDDGKIEQRAKVRKLRAIIGTRDRVNHLVELVRLEDPKKNNEDFPIKDDLLFIFEKGQGLRDEDLVKLEEEEE